MNTSTYFSLSNNFLAGLILLVTLLIIAWQTRKREWYFRSRGCPFPPGPNPLPFVGNLFNIPSGEHPWKVYSKWSSTYGNIIYLRAVQTPMIIVSSARVALDLMEKRSAIYSDKPAFAIDEITASDFNMGLMPYGERWKNTRRAFHQYFNQAAVINYRHSHVREIRAFLRRAVDFEGKLEYAQIRQALASVVIDAVYGIKITHIEDEYINLNEEALRFLSESRRSGAFWVDFMPVLKHIPAWVPGAAAAKLGARSRPVVQKMVNMPFDSVKYGKRDQESIALQMLTRIEHKSDWDEVRRTAEEQHARDAAGVAYLAAVDTTTITLGTFFCAMAMHPEIQSKAQHELEEVVGSDRLPEFDDYVSLPYCLAIILECIRWLPAGPLGVAHKLTTDDFYDGYFIPKGTVVIPNAWAMLYDPDDYPQPERFNPERYLKDGKLNPEVRDPGTIAFGFGRRICAGRYFAKDVVFIAIASILHVFDIVPSLDEDGNPVDPTPRPTTGLFSRPDQLRCMLKSRSAAAKQLINTSA